MKLQLTWTPKVCRICRIIALLAVLPGFRAIILHTFRVQVTPNPNCKDFSTTCTPSASPKTLVLEDFDNDGYLSMSDLRSAYEKFKIPNSSGMSLV